MSEKELHELLTSLLAYPKENEFLEFKINQHEKDEIGKRISALSNGAALLLKSLHTWFLALKIALTKWLEPHFSLNFSRLEMRS
jgi:hypothetical protein